MKLGLFLSLVVAAGAAPSLADQGVVSFTGGNIFATFQGDGDTVGWTFRAETDIIVTSLGYWDGDQNMSQAIHVGIWNTVGQLLATTSVTPASPLTGVWRFAPITPLNLAAGEEYRIGAYVPPGNPAANGYVSNGTSVVTGSGITFLSMARDADGPQTGLNYPTVLTVGVGRFGPNFEFHLPPCAADLSSSSDPNDPGYGVPDGTVDSADFFYYLDLFERCR